MCTSHLFVGLLLALSSVCFTVAELLLVGLLGVFEVILFTYLGLGRVLL